MTSTVKQMKPNQRFLRHSLSPVLVGLLGLVLFTPLAQAQEDISLRISLTQTYSCDTNNLIHNGVGVGEGRGTGINFVPPPNHRTGDVLGIVLGYLFLLCKGFLQLSIDVS